MSVFVVLEFPTQLSASNVIKGLDRAAWYPLVIDTRDSAEDAVTPVQAKVWNIRDITVLPQTEQLDVADILVTRARPQR